MNGSGSASPASATPVVLAGFAAGVALLQTRATLPAATGAWLLFAIALAIAAVAWRRHALDRAATGAAVATQAVATPRGSLILCALVAAIGGFAYAAWRADLRLADALPEAWEGADVVIVGVVDDLPDLSDRGARFAFAVERVEPQEARVPRRVSLSWSAERAEDDAEAEAPVVHAGERWRFTVRLKRPHGYANPGGFDLEAWLFERNLRATGYVHVRGGEGATRIDAFAGRPLDVVQRARERVRERIAAALAGETYAGVVAALAIGDQRAIPDAQWTVFNRTGIGHLVSISGLHVTALAALAAWVVAIAARRSVRITDALPARSVGAIAGVVAAGVYTLLAGAEVPAQRTFAMLAAGAAGLVLARQSHAPILWLWALAAVLAFDPWAVLAPGCWLSFGAVAVLILAVSGRVAGSRGPTRASRVAATIGEGARTQWAVTVGLVPFTLVLFGQVSLVSPIANAVAIPLVTLAVAPLAVAGIVVPGDACFVAAHLLLAPLMRWLTWLAEAPVAAWVQHTPLAWTIAAAALGVAWLLAPRGVPGRPLGAVWLLPLFVVMPEPPPEGSARIAVLDVGQGLAVVVRTHAHALVYDTGPRWHATADAGLRIVAPYLRHEGIGRLDRLVISHQDLDHAGGAASLLRLTPVDRVVSSLPRDHPALADAGGVPSQRCERGMHWERDGVKFAVLHPTPALYDDPRTRTNDLSCVVLVDAGGTRVLLAGDIESRSEARLLRELRDLLAAHVLVVPHHGSRTSSTVPFVAAVDPAIAIFTPGYRNRFGHPRADVVARYVARGAATLRTDLDGAIVFDAGPAGIENLARTRHTWARYWRDRPDMSAGSSN
ncbi:MAG: DNA internalization-related competence protein ComEC/Rec2 [Betaproteobacteria bacterium]